MLGRTRTTRGGARAALAAATVSLALCAGAAGCGPGHTAGSAGRSPGVSHSPGGPRWNPRPASIAALGDSITRGYNACSPLTDCPSVSWATGGRSTVGSLATRLPVHPAGHHWNFAVTGARMADLPGQARRAAAVRPALVTVLMGANDVCAPNVAGMTSIRAFEAHFTSAMDTLRRASPATEVYVASLPDLMRLWSVGRRSPLARGIWRFGVCPSMLGDAVGTSAADNGRRDAVRAREVAFDGVLKRVCAQYRLCRYDGGAVSRQSFSSAELSPWDWFHPSARGERLLASLAYREVTRAG